MLRLFSSIRKTLINEGKTSRYVRYAVGEVLLIVFGILIALQINNWNEGRKLVLRKAEFVKNMTVDFQTNRDLLNEKIESFELKVENLSIFLAEAVNNESNLTVAELKSLFDSFLQPTFFQPVVSSYQSALSTGLIDNLGNPGFREQLVEFERISRQFIELDSLSRQDHFLGPRSQLNAKLGDIRVLSNSRTPPEAFNLSDREYRELITQKEVYSVLSLGEQYRSRQLSLLKRLKDTTQQILTALEALDQ